MSICEEDEDDSDQGDHSFGVIEKGILSCNQSQLSDQPSGSQEGSLDSEQQEGSGQENLDAEECLLEHLNQVMKKRAQKKKKKINTL